MRRGNVADFKVIEAEEVLVFPLLLLRAVASSLISSLRLLSPIEAVVVADCKENYTFIESKIL